MLVGDSHTNAAAAAEFAAELACRAITVLTVLQMIFGPQILFNWPLSKPNLKLKFKLKPIVSVLSYQRVNIARRPITLKHFEF